MLGAMSGEIKYFFDAVLFLHRMYSQNQNKNFAHKLHLHFVASTPKKVVSVLSQASKVFKLCFYYFLISLWCMIKTKG